MRWPVGVALTSWHYMWRTTPLHRSEVQGPDDGAGPYFHRVYRTRIRDTDLTPDALVSRIAADLNRVAPGEFARFHKVLGAGGELRMGDEYVVRMPGPWDGPVRVVERTP